jgi:hypothetical protein
MASVPALDLATEIEVQAQKVLRLARLDSPQRLDRMRNETAELQALIAEAMRAEQLARY